MILILGCSVLKTSEPGPARIVYAGRIVRLGVDYAKLMGYECLILSGKYGLITPDTIIEPYDMRLTKPYDGPWPQAEGAWIGSKDYFSKAPEHIRRYFPKSWSYGQQKGYLNRMVRPELYRLA